MIYNQNVKSLLIGMILLLAQQNYSVRAQSWAPVDGDVIGSGVHGFTEWNDKLIIGGSFSSPCGRIAEWDSTSYSCMGLGVGIVARAAITYNQDLVVVGDFWNVKQPCTDCNGVARWDGTQWQAMGTGFNNDVLALTIWNGNLIASGAFKEADGLTCKRVAQWDGSGWSSIGGLDTTVHGQVRALAVYNNELWIAGGFYVDNCVNCTGVAKWNGSAWENVNIPNGLGDTVRALYVDEEQNKIYMGGHFSELDGDSSMKGIAVFDGSSWSALGSGVSGKGEYVRAITKYNGKIIIGGYFSQVDGTINAKRVAQWDPNTLIWSNIGDGLKKGYVRALISYKGELYAGGSFNISGGVAVNYIAKWYESPVNSTGLKESEQSNVSIYPNPSSNKIHINVPSTYIGTTYRMCDNVGRIVLSGILESEETTIELSNISRGAYLFSTDDGHTRSLKIIKE